MKPLDNRREIFSESTYIYSRSPFHTAHASHIFERRPSLLFPVSSPHILIVCTHLSPSRRLQVQYACFTYSASCLPTRSTFFTHFFARPKDKCPYRPTSSTCSVRQHKRQWAEPQAAHYGTPQTRVRFFLFGAKRTNSRSSLPRSTFNGDIARAYGPRRALRLANSSQVSISIY